MALADWIAWLFPPASGPSTRSPWVCRRSGRSQARLVGRLAIGSVVLACAAVAATIYRPVGPTPPPAALARKARGLPAPTTQASMPAAQPASGTLVAGRGMPLHDQQGAR